MKWSYKGAAPSEMTNRSFDVIIEIEKTIYQHMKWPCTSSHQGMMMRLVISCVHSKSILNT